MADNFQPNIISTLLMGEPRLMRDSICTLLNAIPSVEINGVRDLFEADQDLPDDSAFNCIILDCSGGEELPAVVWISKFKKEHPHIRCLVISASSKHNAAYRSAGADLVLVRGFTLGELQQSLQDLFATLKS
jgi:DNA-binding NarL/FixJ family response regulator